MPPSNVFPQEQTQEDKMSLPSQLNMQYKQWSFFKDFADQAVQDIATIQQNEVVERVWTMLQTMAARCAAASKDITGIQSLPMYAPKKQQSPLSATVLIQRQKKEFVGEMGSFGYEDAAVIASAWDAAGGNKEHAIDILNSSSRLPSTPEPHLQNTNQQWDASSPNHSTPEANNPEVAQIAPVTPINRKRKADSSFTATSPSSVQHANSSVYSPAPSSTFTPAKTPATPRPTHSPYTPDTPGTYLARRKPSSMAPQDQDALFTIVKKLAPSSDYQRFWKPVADTLAKLGFHKSETAWKLEWCRYGAYEHGFNERIGVFVNSEVEKLKLLRCLDPKPKAEVKRAIQELEQEDDDDVVVIGSVKRQKVMGGFVEADGGVVSANGQSWLAASNFPPQEYAAPVEYVEDVVQTPAIQEPFDVDFAAFGGYGDGVVSADGQSWLAASDFPLQKFDASVGYIEEVQTPAPQEPFDGSFADLSDQQYAEEVEEFGMIETPEVEASINHNDQ